MFAAIAPLSGAYVPKWNAELLSDLPTWLFHGQQDGTVNRSWSEDYYRNVTGEMGGIVFSETALGYPTAVSEPIRCSRVPGGFHKIWDDIYANNDTALYDWMFAQTRMPEASIPLFAGDADQDFDFDQLDLVLVQVSAKYFSGQAATWGEGDWDGAPGGTPGNPPAGDGVFNQLDIIASQQAGAYLTGPYAAIHPDGQRGDGQTSVVYTLATGELAVEYPAGVELTSVNIDSANVIFTGQAAQNLGGSFDNDSDQTSSKLRLAAASERLVSVMWLRPDCPRSMSWAT